jgi:hypothetical protein
MIKTSLGKALIAVAAVDRLPANVVDTVSLGLMLMSDYLEGPAKMYQKKRLEIAAEVGTPDENGGFTFDGKPGAAAEFNRRENDLLEQEIELPFKPIPVKDLQRSEGSKFALPADRRPEISPSVLRALKPFLAFPEETAAPTGDNVTPIRPNAGA